jgi:hypothetical protein
VIAGANWGARADERALGLACEELLPDAPVRLHRAVSIHAGPSMVFRWLCQLKLAPYSYDLIDNLGRGSPRELTPGIERLEVGQRFMTIFSLASFVEDEHITLLARRTAVTYAVRQEERLTRLVARVLFDPPGGLLGAALTARALALGDLVMMRRQLLRLKAFAERDAAGELMSDSTSPGARR